MNAAPVISSVTINDTTPSVGETLTATIGYSAGYPAPTPTYQWQQDSAGNGVFADIVGQTAQTLSVLAAYAGNALRVQGSASNGSGSAGPTASSATSRTTQAPVLATPTIDDTTPTEGQTLTASYSLTTAGYPTASITYQWLRAGVAILGATSSTYVVQSADVGSALSVTVTATNSAGLSDSETSASTSAAVTSNVAPVLNTPTIDDTTPTEGQTLTASYSHSNSPSPSPTISYQWKRGATNVGSNSATYVVQAGDVGSTLTVTVTSTNIAGSDSETSAATSTVVASGGVPATPVLAPVAETSWLNLASPTVQWTQSDAAYGYGYLLQYSQLSDFSDLGTPTAPEPNYGTPETVFNLSILGLADGPWYFRGVTYAADGVTISAVSNTITYTVASDDVPAAFSFTDETGETASSSTTSNTITISGLSTGRSVPVTVTGAGSYIKNGGSASTAATTAVNGDTFALTHTNSGSASTATATTLDVNGVSDTYTTTTAAGGGGAYNEADPSTPSYHDFGGYGRVNRSFALNNGATINSVGLYASEAGSATFYIVRRNSAGTYECMYLQNVTLAGTSTQENFTLTAPYVVPGTGDFYVAVYVADPGPALGYNLSTSRAWDFSGWTTVGEIKATFNEDSGDAPWAAVSGTL